MRIHLFFLLLLFTTPLLAQDSTDNTPEIRITQGNVFKNDEREIPIDIIGHDENGYYILYAGGRFGQKKNKSIRKFTPSLEPSGEEIDLIPEDQEGEARTIGIAQTGDKIVHVWSLLTETEKKLFYQLIDLDDFSLQSSSLITAFSNEETDITRTYSNFIMSQDKSRIYLLYGMPTKKGETARINLKVFDNSFKEIKNESYDFPYPEDTFYIHDLFFSDKDELMVLAKKYNSDRILKEERNKGYQYLLYQLQDQEFHHIADIPVNDKHLRMLEPVWLPDGNLVLTGLYSKLDIYAMSGVFYTRIDTENGTVISAKEHPFGHDFYTALLDNENKINRVLKKLEKQKYEDPYYILRKVLKKPDDHIVLLTEQIHSVSHDFVIQYFHENIAMIELDGSGDIVWTNKIGKKNIKNNVSIYSSFFPVKRANDIFLLYNGNSSNLDHRKGNLANAFAPNGRAFMATKVRDDGTYLRTVLATGEDMEGITIRPSLTNWIDENTLLLFGQDIDNLKNQRFIKVIFEP
ncbi:hypothetical protein [Sinomicrobium oceani]|uniref:hypothetical protein n=1 Tax=Sinomicrobium oceani TaxID=1150368 RepID=UPI00227B49ED|nr:hypothetical protein [Sinomicrobium oceani]